MKKILQKQVREDYMPDDMKAIVIFLAWNLILSLAESLKKLYANFNVRGCIHKESKLQLIYEKF